MEENIDGRGEPWGRASPLFYFFESSKFIHYNSKSIPISEVESNWECYQLKLGDLIEESVYCGKHDMLETTYVCVRLWQFFIQVWDLILFSCYPVTRLMSVMLSVFVTMN